MKSIWTTIKNVWSWLVFSSANPTQVSLTVKSLGSLAVVQLIFSQVLPFLGYHPAFDLNTLADGASTIVYYGANTVLGIAGLIGAIRKVTLTIQGKNAS